MDSHDLSIRDFHLRPGMLVLATTREVIHLTAGYAAQVSGLSTNSRMGLNINSGAPWIDPGFKGTITLELSVASVVPVVLYKGMRIAQFIFHELSSPAMLALRRC